jgi:flagellar biosynthesis chaperone FliJ
MKSQLLKELHTVNTAIADAETQLQTLKQRRQTINQQISEELIAGAEMDRIKARLQKTREALTL